MSLPRWGKTWPASAPAFVVPYGPLGAELRVVTAAIAEGAGIDPLVFGSPVVRWAAPGDLVHQPFVGTLLDMLRLGELSGEARIFALVGRPPTSSPSRAFHNAAFRALGTDAVYLDALDVPPADALRLPLAGFSVTTPWKVDAARVCDRLEPLAERIGAVNTVVRDVDGALVGSNTDAEALRDALASAGIGRGDAAVIGNGGFARAAAVVLGDVGFAVRHEGREPAIRPTDAIVVNATPEGARGPLDPAMAAAVSAIGEGAVVIDAPYAARNRPGAFAVACRTRGLRVIDGPTLLVAQAKGQVRRFTGRDAPPDVLEFAIRCETNLVLVGARGAGKTSVGRAVAARLGRPFVDTDDELGRRAGRPAGRVLEERGEAAFRVLERDEVRRASARWGVVIAVGGGALTTEGSGADLAARGFVVHLFVSAADAARRIEADRASRPRLTDASDLVAECARLIQARTAGYAGIANAVVPTDGRAVQAIAEDVAAAWLASTQTGAGADFRA